MSVLVALALAHTLMSSVVVVMAMLVTQVMVQSGGAVQALCRRQGTVVKVTLTAE